MKRFLPAWFSAAVLSAAAFADSVVVFNEIMYHPAANEPALEWVELHNQQAVDVDIAGWRLAKGIEFTFPPGTRIRGRGYLVVAVDPAALMAATPGLTGVFGPFSGRLSNSGETLVLQTQDGRVMDEVDYGTDGEWPVAADGAGSSVAKRASNLGSEDSLNWAMSVQVGGTPGAANFPAGGPILPTVGISEAGTPGPGFFLEITNHGENAVDLGGLVLKRFIGAEGSFTLPAQQLAPGAFATFTTAQLGFEPLPGDGVALVVGDGSAVLDAVRITPQGRARNGARGEWGTPNAPTPGAANTFTFPDAVVLNEIFYHGRATPAVDAVVEKATPLLFTSTWKYHQAGVDLGTAWRQAGYDDSAWASGAGLLGSEGGGPSYAATVLADAPLAYWKLDDANTTITDASGQGRNGSGTAGVQRSVSPLVSTDPGSSAMTFSGPNRATIPGFEKIGPGGYTVEYWVRVNELPTNCCLNLVGDGETGDDFFMMNYLLAAPQGGAGAIRPHYSFANSPVAMDSNTRLAPGNIYHVATTWDAATPTNNAAIYINGVLDKTTTVSRNVPPPGGTGANQVFLGYDNRAAPEGNITLDEVALYNRPLSAARIAAHYQAGNTPGPRQTTLTAGPATHYFRSSFNFARNPATTTLTMRLVVDDGAVVWLNGQELHRQNMPGGAVSYATPASTNVAAPAFTSSFSVPAGALVQGGNVVAVEVHQSTGANDVLFGMELAAETAVSPAAPYRESGEQWVELFNRSGAAVDLTGWRLGNGIDYFFPDGTQLAAGGFLVVAKDPAALLAKFPGVNVLGPFDKSLGGGGDRVVLKDVVGNVADRVEYFDGGRWAASADGGGSSLELRDARADNTAPEAWEASDESGRSSWQTYSYRKTASDDGGPTRWNELDFGLLDAGECLIDDITVTESPGAPAAVQKITNGDFSAGAAGWRFLGNHGTSAVEPEPGTGNQVLHVRATGETEHMHNHIEATFTNNVPIVSGREYEISFRAKSISGSRQLHTRLYHNRVARVNVLAVAPQMGTPGAANSRAVANIGPNFRNLRHTPVVPAAAQPVTVRVEAADPDGVNGAVLFYSVNGAAAQSTPMTLSNGSWAADIPGQGAGVLVQFYVRATDGLGGTADFPARGPASRALVIWNDGLADLPLAHNFRLLMTAADRNFLFTTRERMSNGLLRGTVIYDENEVFYDIGARLKGSERGRVDDARIGYHVEFDSAQLFRGVHKTVTIDRSGNYRSNTSFGQDEILVKHLINAAGGVASSYDDIIRLIVPGTTHTGSALLQMARYKNDYLDSAYENGSAGSLYKMELIYFPLSTDGAGYKVPAPDEVIGTDLGDRGSDKEVYRWFFLHENNVERDDWDSIIALGRAISKNGAELDAAIAPLIDGSQWARTFALQTLCGIGDTYTRGNNHNFYFYQRPSDGRVLALPWDWDFAFITSPNDSIFGGQNGFKVLQRPQYLRLYYAHLQDLMNTVYNTDYMSYWTGHYVAFTSNNQNADFSGVLNYIGQRRTYVQSVLNGIAQAPLAITNPPPEGTLTNASSLALSGTAPWNAETVQLSGPGGTVDVSFSTVNNWQAAMPLLLGTNVVTLTTYAVNGTVLGTRTFSVVSTATTGFADADGDGLPDAWEKTHGLGDLPSASAAAADIDFDGEGNLAEYLAGTDPRNSASVLTVTPAKPTAETVQLKFVALAGRRYEVQFREELASGSWQTLVSYAPANSDRQIEATDTPPAGQPRRFYRLRTP